MNTKALNKKLDELLDKLIEDFKQTSINLHTLNVFIIVLLDFLLSLGPYSSIAVYIVIFLTLMELGKKNISFNIAFLLLIAIFISSEAIWITLTMLIAFLSINLLYLTLISKKLYVALLALIFQVGDGFTTFIGLKRGFTEQNLILLNLIDFFGSYGIIIPKLFVLGLIFWVYRSSELPNYYLMVIYLVGFYLVISNVLVFL
jgi:hypothetical protein